MLVITGLVTEAIGAAPGLGGLALTAWNIAKWPIILALVIAIIAVLYYATPNVRQPRFRWISIGSSIALIRNATLITEMTVTPSIVPRSCSKPRPSSIS